MVRRLDHFQAAASLRAGERVRARYVEELARADRRERVRTHDQHRMIADAPVQLRLVLHEFPPLLLLEPRGIPAHPDALVASGQRLLELGVPVADDAMKIDLPSGEIYVPGVQNLDTLLGYIPFEPRN